MHRGSCHRLHHNRLRPHSGGPLSTGALRGLSQQQPEKPLGFLCVGCKCNPLSGPLVLYQQNRRQPQSSLNRVLPDSKLHSALKGHLVPVPAVCSQAHGPAVAPRPLRKRGVLGCAGPVLISGAPLGRLPPHPARVRLRETGILRP